MKKKIKTLSILITLCLMLSGCVVGTFFGSVALSNLTVESK